MMEKSNSINQLSGLSLAILASILIVLPALPAWAIDFIAYGFSEDPSMEQESNVWRVEIPSNAAGDPINRGYRSACLFRDDFDIQVDFRLDQWPGNNGVRVGMGTQEFAVMRLSLGENDFWDDEPRERYALDISNTGISFATASDTAGRLRLKRVGSELTGYYQRNGGWVPLGIGAADTSNTEIALGLHTSPKLFVQKTVAVTFENFLINSGECTSTEIQAVGSEPGRPELSVSIESSKQIAVGKKAEAVITITNQGDVDVFSPIVSAKVSGNAVRRFGDRAKALSMSATVEFLGGEKVSNIDFQWERSGFKTEISNKEEPVLLSLDSRRIRVLFVPTRGGRLEFSAKVNGKSAQAQFVDALVKEDLEIEPPTLELGLVTTDPLPYAHDQQSKLPLHNGNRITFEIGLFNSSKNADLLNGIFWIESTAGEIIALKSDDNKASCPELSDPVKEAKCKIPELRNGELTYFSSTIIYDAPEVIFFGSHGSGSDRAEFKYEIGANVDPVVLVKFDPDPKRKLITPGTEITAEFSVRNIGEDVLDGGELLIYPPDRNVFPEVYIGELFGCKYQWVNIQIDGEDSEAEMWSDVYQSIPGICGLDRFSSKQPETIKATFGKIPGKALNEHLVIAWDLKMPGHSFRASEQTRGSVAYLIASEFVDLSVEGYQDLGESLSGKIGDAELFIRNRGSISQKKVVLRIEVDLARSKEYDESIIGELRFPGGKNYLDWFKQPTLSIMGPEGREISVKCPKSHGRFNRFECDLGTVDPGDLAIVFIEWDQELPAGVIYSYEAWFKESGEGEGILGGSLDDNRIMGSGRVVDVKTEVLEEDTKCSAQKPNGHLTIISPNAGSVEDGVIEVKQLTNARGSFDSIPVGMEIWVYSFSPVAKRYSFKRARMYGETSGDWTVKALGFGRPGKEDIGFTYKLGVVLADKCTGDNIETDPSGLFSLPEGVKIMDEIRVQRIGE